MNKHVNIFPAIKELDASLVPHHCSHRWLMAGIFLVSETDLLMEVGVMV